MFEIKKMRERAGMTQQEVADALGVKKSRYGDWERETREVNLRDAITIADLFHCTLDELVGRKPRLQGTGAESFTESEERIVSAYRSATPQGRAAIEAVAQSQEGMVGQSESHLEQSG